jgi:hypothetical protein
VSQGLTLWTRVGQVPDGEFLLCPGRQNDAVAFPGLAGFPWQAPPSVCHPTDAVASTVVRALGSMKEVDGHGVLRRGLASAIDRWGAEVGLLELREGVELIVVLIVDAGISARRLRLRRGARARRSWRSSPRSPMRARACATSAARCFRSAPLLRPCRVVCAWLNISCLAAADLPLRRGDPPTHGQVQLGRGAHDSEGGERSFAPPLAVHRRSPHFAQTPFLRVIR